MTQENEQPLVIKADPTKPRRALLDDRLYQSTDEWKQALQGNAPIGSATRMGKQLAVGVRVMAAVGRTLSLLVGKIKQ